MSFNSRFIASTTRRIIERRGVVRFDEELPCRAPRRTFFVAHTMPQRLQSAARVGESLPNAGRDRIGGRHLGSLSLDRHHFQEITGKWANPMSTVLPDLSHSQCRFLRLCGSVEMLFTDAPPALASKTGYPSSRYEVNGMGAFVRVGWSQSSKGGNPHLHFDIAREDWFVSRNQTVPSVNFDAAELSDVLSALNGVKYNLEIEGLILESEGHLPNLIGKIIKRSRFDIDGTKLELTKGLYTISNGPIKSIGWEQLKRTSDYQLDLIIRRPNIQITPSLFVTALEAVETVYAAFDGGKKNVG